MRISKRQLRRIIKEEKAKVLAEQKIRRIVRRRLIEQATWDQASDLLSRLETNPRDGKVFDQVMTMVKGLGDGDEVDMAVDALFAIEDAESPDEMASAADYAIDYVRDAFSAHGVEVDLPSPGGQPSENIAFRVTSDSKSGMGFITKGKGGKDELLSTKKMAKLAGVSIPSTGNRATDLILFLQALVASGVVYDDDYTSLEEVITTLAFDPNKDLWFYTGRGDKTPAAEFYRGKGNVPFEIPNTPEAQELRKEYGI